MTCQLHNFHPHCFVSSTHNHLLSYLETDYTSKDMKTMEEEEQELEEEGRELAVAHEQMEMALQMVRTFLPARLAGPPASPQRVSILRGSPAEACA